VPADEAAPEARRRQNGGRAAESVCRASIRTRAWPTPRRKRERKRERRKGGRPPWTPGVKPTNTGNVSSHAHAQHTHIPICANAQPTANTLAARNKGHEKRAQNRMQDTARTPRRMRTTSVCSALRRQPPDTSARRRLWLPWTRQTYGSKVSRYLAQRCLYMVILHSKCSRVLTFENLCRQLPPLLLLIALVHL